MENLKFLRIKLVKSYNNISKALIYKENNRSGIYCWKNLVTGKIYVGSASNITKRLYGYLSVLYLEKEIRKNQSFIYRALLKYGYNNFNIIILKYCEIQELIRWEQYYIDKLKPEYNILKTAGSRLGFKHSTDTIMKIKKTVQLKCGYLTIIINKKSNNIIKYNSIADAAKSLNVYPSTLSKCYIQTGKLYKGIYLIIRLIKIRKLDF